MSRLLGVIALQPADLETARQLASRLELPLLESEQGFFNAGATSDPGVALIVSDARLELRSYGTPTFTIAVESQQPDIQRRIRAGRKQPFARALGLHKQAGLKILDATAGMGRDALVMHGLGAHVRLLERSPLLHAMLDNALADRPGLELLPCQDAVDYLQHCNQSHDVIYLDPMYPQTRSKALPKKEMQLLRDLMHADTDADALLAPALESTRRVVVKRPPQAGPMAGKNPHHSIEGKRVRYDIYINAAV